eukprot:m.101217 g.101217  ORF g.101217 m.101217 type:complete len:293 (-) comp10380_c0_seq1:180-1058(-)
MPPPISHTFEVESTDHCETPLAAYADVAPILEQMALSLGKTKETVRIYDPYFCAGGVKKHLNKLGFTHVYNENEDFYKMIASKKTPKFDILVTNPPYSTRPFDHIERLMDFCRKHAGAYLILQPCYVYLKPYYVGSLLRSNGGPAGEFYVTPSLRYTYRTPEGLRDVKAGALSTSPFVTFWYGACGSHRDDLTKWWCEKGKDVCKGCSLRLTARKLPRRYKDSHDDTRPRLRKKQREALKRRQDKALGLNPFRNTKKKKGPRKFNRGDAPHRKRGGPGAPSAAAKSAKRRRF